MASWRSKSTSSPGGIGVDVAGMKAGVTAILAAVKELQLDVEELVAEGTRCSLDST